ncbi:hypothetical protein I302_101052 [Kwoniella bestiolae CBS 10118]|uniref:Uncharacterized protein n=1 Tax=Kwoniella bestiolae CBS 10118 TaxID=1296100 RepID=A0A1B9G6X9_9TREE|nr:hypothetical protein I302_04428 [Kwoniella bestiolae CBS 10118]OCF26740.1 hypothetical protein I302_04428 [Kwoniella bestiolae CBS 10118]
MSSTTTSRTFIFTPPPDGAPVGWTPSNNDNTNHGGISKTVLAIILTLCGVVLFWLLAMGYWIYSIRKLRRTKLLAQHSTEGRRQTWLDASNIPSPPISPITHTFGFGLGLGRTHNTSMAKAESEGGRSNHRHSIGSTVVGSEYTAKSSGKGILRGDGEKRTSYSPGPAWVILYPFLLL